ncbi:single-stranded DNA-binding protein [Bifidobacterium dolichotidis]|nr:single-stranded DNA-binding protein [Bifidobacterium dolichotidis]
MAMQQAMVTVNGFLGSDVQEFGSVPSHSGSMFRLGSTRRYQDKMGEWRNLPTTWITVKAFRTLGQNAAMSLRKGDPVIVMGLLNTESWQAPDGTGRSRLVLDAQVIGHDLSFGISNFKRPKEANGQRVQDQSQQVTASEQSGTEPNQQSGQQEDSSNTQVEQQSPVQSQQISDSNQQIGQSQQPMQSSRTQYNGAKEASDTNDANDDRVYEEDIDTSIDELRGRDRASISSLTNSQQKQQSSVPSQPGVPADQSAEQLSNASSQSAADASAKTSTRARAKARSSQSAPRKSSSTQRSTAQNKGGSTQHNVSGTTEDEFGVPEM